jgi:hypothetical protein
MGRRVVPVKRMTEKLAESVSRGVAFTVEVCRLYAVGNGPAAANRKVNLIVQLYTGFAAFAVIVWVGVLTVIGLVAWIRDKWFQ